MAQKFALIIGNSNYQDSALAHLAMPEADVNGLADVLTDPQIGGFDDVKPLLGIPNELDVLAIVPFGYPPGPVTKGKKNRKALSEVAHHGRFGQPFK